MTAFLSIQLDPFQVAQYSHDTVVTAMRYSKHCCGVILCFTTTEELGLKIWISKHKGYRY